MSYLGKIPYPPLIVAALLLGLSPFVPEPHALEKIRMLLAGTLVRPIDIFDLLFHTAPLVLLLLKFVAEKKSA